MSFLGVSQYIAEDDGQGGSRRDRGSHIEYQYEPTSRNPGSSGSGKYAVMAFRPQELLRNREARTSVPRGDHDRGTPASQEKHSHSLLEYLNRARLMERLIHKASNDDPKWRSMQEFPEVASKNSSALPRAGWNRPPIVSWRPFNRGTSP